MTTIRIFFCKFFISCVRFTQYSLSIISKNLTNEGTTKNKTRKQKTHNTKDARHKLKK